MILSDVGCHFSYLQQAPIYTSLTVFKYLALTERLSGVIKTVKYISPCVSTDINYPSIMMNSHLSLRLSKLNISKKSSTVI